MRLQDKVALVTGAASGFGAEDRPLFRKRRRARRRRQPQ